LVALGKFAGNERATFGLYGPELVVEVGDADEVGEVAEDPEDGGDRSSSSIGRTGLGGMGEGSFQRYIDTVSLTIRSRRNSALL
jgi:hypothetical protein